MFLAATKSLSINDIIKRSFLEYGGFQNAMTFETLGRLLIAMTVSLAVGLYIYLIYRLVYRGVIFDRTFAITLVGMTVLTCLVTLAISTNVVLSLGMVGALSIVRYRTAIKEPFNLLFIFWAITSGIASGAYMYQLTCLGLAFVTLLVFLLNAREIGGQVFIMVLRYKGGDVESEMKRLFESRKIKYVIKSKTLRGGDVEMAVELFIKNNNLTFAEKLQELENVNNLTLIQYNGEYHG